MRIRERRLGREALTTNSENGAIERSSARNDRENKAQCEAVELPVKLGPFELPSMSRILQRTQATAHIEPSANTTKAIGTHSNFIRSDSNDSKVSRSNEQQQIGSAGLPLSSIDSIDLSSPSSSSPRASVDRHYTIPPPDWRSSFSRYAMPDIIYVNPTLDLDSNREEYLRKAAELSSAVQLSRRPLLSYKRRGRMFRERRGSGALAGIRKSLRSVQGSSRRHKARQLRTILDGLAQQRVVDSGRLCVRRDVKSKDEVDTSPQLWDMADGRNHDRSSGMPLENLSHPRLRSNQWLPLT